MSRWGQYVYRKKGTPKNEVPLGTTYNSLYGLTEEETCRQAGRQRLLTGNKPI